MNIIGIIEIGSSNTKTHIYENDKIIYEKTNTIEFKKNYKNYGKVTNDDINKLGTVIEKGLEYTNKLYLLGCSIFRKLSLEELDDINNYLESKYKVKITVVSQEEEANLTAFGAFNGIEFKGNICIFIGGGGSMELIFVNNKEIFEHKFYDFGVVDITNAFPDLKDDFNTCTFETVYNYAASLIGEININCDLLILAGGDHLYWYENAGYELGKNTLYENSKQQYMLTINKSDEFDKDALKRSLEEIKNRSDNPLWFNGSRAMKVITNVISHKVNAKYIIPTKINMEDGFYIKIKESEK